MVRSRSLHHIPTMTAQNHPATAAADNPLLETWTGPFGVPPFGRVVPEHFMPAYEHAFAEHDAEIAAIANDPATPTFQNTIEAMERAGRTAWMPAQASLRSLRKLGCKRGHDEGRSIWPIVPSRKSCSPIRAGSTPRSS